VLGHAYLERGQLAEAEEIFDYLAGLGGKFTQCQSPLAAAQLGLGHYEAAAKTLHRFLSTAPVKAAKAIRAHLDEWVHLAPESPDIRGFQAEFLRVEGKAASEYERLLNELNEDSLRGGEIVLLAELAVLCEQEEELAQLLEEKTGTLLKHELNWRPLLDAARRCGTGCSEIQACFRLAKEVDHNRGSADQFTEYFERIPAIVEEQATTRPQVVAVAGKELLRLGATARALELLTDHPVETAEHHSEWLGMVKEVRGAAMRQQMTEAARMLAEKENPGVVVIDTRFGPIRLMPGSRYERYIGGEPLTPQERFSEMYRLSTAILFLNEPREQIQGFLQDVATSNSEYRNAASLRLARILFERGDQDTAQEYLNRITSFDQAAQVAPGETLADAYALARACEEEDPQRALDLYRSITLNDLDYRDARSRREALAAGHTPPPASGGTPPPAPTPELQAKTEVQPVSEEHSPVCLPEEGNLVDGRYRILSEIGLGGMGAVYKATDERLKRIVALKVVRPGLDPLLTQAEERFELEAQLAGQLLKEPGIVTVLDIGRAPTPYMVMEYVEGINLRELCDERLPTVAEVGGILSQVARTLHAAHREGILHRDIKPSNILIEGAGTLKVKIADFGLAKFMEEAERRLTVTGAVIGTKAYMSPEQVKGLPLDGRSDLYAWSCLAYEMCAGYPPFTGGELAYCHVHEPPEPLAKKNLIADLPKGFFDLVMQGLAKSADDRPKDMAEVADRMEALFAQAQA
jgi:tetratricopeptide (TPR) repeat protein